MALYLKDRIYVQILINDVDIPLDKLNVLDYLHIVESVRIYLPMLTLRLIDATKFLSQNNLLGDGAIIKISIGLGTIKRVYEFRKFNHEETLGAGGTEYLISGYLNVPNYWVASSFTPMKGTPTEVLKKIALGCNLKFEGVTTSDSQIWMPYNTRWCEYARQVAERAWVDKESCIQIAVTGQGVMRMVNVSDFETRKPAEAFSNNGDDKSAFPISDYNTIAKSGFFNVASGYQDSKIVQTLTAHTDVDLDKLVVKRNSRKISINKDVKDQVGQARVAYAPIDVGNVSSTYEKALYQNRRLSNLYNYGANFVTPRLVDSEVMDLVVCEFSKPEVSDVQEISGVFLLTSKVTYIEGLNFYQKCEVFRHGLNLAKDNKEL
jgi:hypothetical protein